MYGMDYVEYGTFGYCAALGRDGLCHYYNALLRYDAERAVTGLSE